MADGRIYDLVMNILYELATMYVEENINCFHSNRCIHSNMQTNESFHDDDYVNVARHIHDIGVSLHSLSDQSLT